MYQELGAAWLEQCDRLLTVGVSDAEQKATTSQTLIDLHICGRLPFIHGDNPFAIFFSAAQINDELFRIMVEGLKDCLQTVGREPSSWE